MKLSNVLEQHVPQSRLVDTPAVGAKMVPIALTPEETADFEQNNLPLPPESLYVVHAFVERLANNIERQDQLKLRTSQPDVEAVNAMIDDALQVIITTDTDRMPKKWESTKLAVDRFQRWLKAGDKVTVVPMPSSSPVSKMIAQKICSLYGAHYVDCLEKNPWPRFSDASPGVDPSAKRYAEERERLIQARDQAEAANDEDAYVKYDDAVKRLVPFSRKSHMRDVKSLHGRAYYDTISPNDSLHSRTWTNTYVLLVDDNIISGHSIADAIKGLYYNGIQPVAIMGFAPHLYK